MLKGTVDISSVACPVTQHAPLITSFVCAQCDRTVLLGLVICKKVGISAPGNLNNLDVFCDGCVGVGMEGRSCLCRQGGIPTYILLLEQIQKEPIAFKTSPVLVPPTEEYSQT